MTKIILYKILFIKDKFMIIKTTIMANYNVNKNNFSEEKLDEYMLTLKYASVTNRVVKGLKETLRAIESGQARVVFSAFCENQDYMNLIKIYCDLYKTEIIFIENWMDLRDIVFNCKPSTEIEEKARKQGKIAKIKPKCYCVAIIDN